MLLNCCVQTALNTKELVMFKWLLDNGADLNLLTENSKQLIKRYGNEEFKKLTLFNS